MGSIKWVYGIALVYFALEGFTSDINILSDLFLPWAVIIVGVLISFTPMTKSIYGTEINPSILQKIRRWGFGIVIVLIGIISLNIPIPGLDFYGQYLTIYSLYGQAILALIGVIYLFAGTKAGNRTIYSQ
mgnify:CR=1 FL=1